MSKLIYRLYGLTVVSEATLPITEYIQNNDEIDYSVIIGQVLRPEKLEHPYLDIPHLQVDKHFFFQEISGLARFKIDRHKSKITIELLNDDLDNIWPFFLDTPLSVALLYKGIFSLRAGAVLSNNGAQLFCGNRGCGKSTMTAIIYQNGFPFLADNRSLLHWNGIKNSYEMAIYEHHAELWPDVNKALKETSFKYSGFIRNGLLKQKFTIKKEKLKQDYFTVDTIHLINVFTQDGQPEILTGISKLAIINQMIHAHQLIDYLDIQEKIFQFLTQFCNQVRIKIWERDQLLSPEKFIKPVADDIYQRSKTLQKR